MTEAINQRATELKSKIEAAGLDMPTILQELYGVKTLREVLRNKTIGDVERAVDQALTARAEAGPPARAAKANNTPPPAPAQKAKVLPVHGVFAEYTTLTGIKLCDLPAAIDAEYPRAAYSAAPLAGGMKGTDVNTYYLRQRLDQVFGVAGVGWRLVPMPGIGTIDRRQETRQGKGREYSVWVVTLIMWQFEFCLLTPAPQWFTLSVMTDAAENEDEGYAARGAMSSLLKQAVRLLGGFDHFTIGAHSAKFKQGAPS